MKPRYFYLRRRLIFIIGKILQPILSRTEITGKSNIPKSGPVIIVGNHSAFVESILMVLALPWPIELIGAGDIPLRQRFLFIQKWYGFIPINRGEIDRTGLKAASDVLEKGGGIGIFPEGGIWDRKIGDARLGVAYLSQQTQAPILPMGFGGVIGAVSKIVRLQRPRFTVNIGPLLPPVPTSENYRERKAMAQTASNEIMDAIYRLVPATDEVNQKGERQEAYSFEVQLTSPSGDPVAAPAELAVPHGDELSLFFHRPVLIDVVITNLERAEAAPLAHLDQERDPARLAAALREAVHVYADEKPAFIGYRLGYQRAGRILDGLRALLKLVEWAAGQNLSINIRPKAVYTYADGQIERFDYPEEMHQA